MESGGRIQPAKLTAHLQRYMKCKDLPEHDRRQAQGYLLKQLFLMRPLQEQNKDPAELLQYLTSLAPRQVCQYQFKTNDIVWICKECQRDETCVICNECYQASNHEGHDVFFYHSVAGGCCDCGDGEAWNCAGFCDKHGNRTQDPVSYIPMEIGKVSMVVFDTIAESLLQYASYVSMLYDTDAPRRERTNDPCTMLLVVDEFHTAEEFTNLLRVADQPITINAFVAQGSASLLTGDFGDCRAMANELQMRGFNALVGYASDLPMQERMIAAVAFLHQLANSSDGMCQLICRVLDEDFLARMLSFHPLLPKELGRAIYDLLLVLMAEQSFKIVIAVAYTQAYPKIARLYGKGLGQSASSAYALSVQFLNREVFVNDVCFAHNFLKVNVNAMNAMLTHAQQMSVNEIVACQGNQLSAAMTKALRHNIIIKRRYNSMIGDLKVIFTNHRISRYFLSCCLDGFLALLESYQYLHPQERALYSHVEYEDQDWMAAFNLNLGITGIFDYLFNWFADSDASCSMAVKYLGLDAHPNSFEILSCVEDGWAPVVQEDAPPPLSFRESLRSQVNRFFNPGSAPVVNPSGGNVTATPGKGAAVAPEGSHPLASVWKVLREITLRCFAWERRFRDTNGIGVTLPPRTRGNNYAQYGADYGEDVQLIDLIQEYAQLGVGKLPRMMSFHIPLHRALATAIVECCKHAHLVVCLRSLQGFVSEQSASNALLLTGSIDIPLFTVTMATQIGLRMWQRNGQAMADQLLNYDCYPFCRIYKELDTLLIQFLLTVHPTDQFVSQLFYRMGIAEYVAHRKSEAIGVVATNDASHLPALLDEALKYVVNLVTELPLPPVATPAPGSTVSGTDARLLPLIRREFLHKMVGGPVTYTQLQECFAINPETAKVSTELVDGLVHELSIKHDSALGPPTYTLKKEMWAEYDPCFPRVPGSVHQKAFEDRPKVTATAPIITKPLASHECFASVRNTLLLAPVLLRVQRDLLFVAAAERCTKNAVYQTVREKWTLKCNDSIYGKVLQLLTLAVYVTQDMKASGGAAAASAALENFVNEECFLPSSESAFNAHIYTAETLPGTKMPALLHVLMDIFYANDPLDASSKNWVMWLIEQLTALSPVCAQSAADYRAKNVITSGAPSSKTTGSADSTQDTSGSSSASPAPSTPASDSKAMSARDKAMQAMKDKAAQFMMMMEGMSSDEDDSDLDKEEDDAPERQGVKSAENVVSVEVRGEGKSAAGSAKQPPRPDAAEVGGLKTGGAEMASGAMEVVSPTDSAADAASSGAGTTTRTAGDEDGIPVCIVCQADANAEDATGNMRVMGYLALVQASTLLTHDCLDCTTHMRIVSDLPRISDKVTPKRPSSECSAQISFCGHGMHQDCFNTYLPSQLRKAAEQSDMVLDQSKLQFCCPLCKKLGNLFVPYVETDPAKIEVREAAKAKLLAALRKKQAQLQSGGDGTAVVTGEPARSGPVVITSDTTGAVATAAVGEAAARAVAASPKSVIIRPDTAGLPVPTISILPSPAQTLSQVSVRWSWTQWIKHPSLVNCDLGAFTRSTGVSLVTFGALADSVESSTLKRARSQTTDSADFGRINTKLNTSPDTPEFLSPQRMDTEEFEDADGGAEEMHDASEMGYALNDIDLNSTSTDRAVAANAALEAELQGITVEDAAASFDEYDTDTDEYHSLMEYAFPQARVDPLRELERALKKNERIFEALRNHAKEETVAQYVRRLAWGKFLEDYLRVHSDTFDFSTAQLAIKVYQPAQSSYSAVAPPLLQAVLRSVAYSCSCDLAEHNLPGYHLLRESDLAALSSTPPSTEKSSGASTPVVPGAAASTDAVSGPLQYAKKYSVGMDEYRYLDKVVDAVACTLHAFSCLDIFNEALVQMFAGTAHRPALPTQLSGEDKTPLWLPVSSPKGAASLEAQHAGSVAHTPLLAAPLADVLVLCIAIAKAAPARRQGGMSTMSSPVKAARNPLYGVQYHPLWNLEHALRWVCLAKLLQLLTMEVEATTDSAATCDAETAFAAFPTVAPFVVSFLRQSAAQGPSVDSKIWTVERAQQVVLQWISFLRTAAHLYYRTSSAVAVASASSNAGGIHAPASWLSEEAAPALFHGAADVTDAQLRKHLQLLSMSEVLSDAAEQAELLSVAAGWVADLSEWSTKRSAIPGLSGVDLGVSSPAEVSDALAVKAAADASSGSPAAMPVLKPSGDNDARTRIPAYLKSPVYASYPRVVRPQLLKLPREYTKLHAQVMSKVAAHRANLSATARPSADGKTEFEHPALCLVCAAVLDAGGKGQCAAHTITCGGETGVYFLLQECQVLLNHGPRGVYYPSPYIDVYGESQHNFRGKPLYLDSRRYEALTHLWVTHQIPREIVSKRSSATRIIINNYY